MMAEDTAGQEGNKVIGLPISVRSTVALLVGVLLALFALYWFVFRVDYVVVFERLPESDAAVVVAELTERKIDHRLADGGTTILVAQDQADQARLDIASSELPLRGQIGFELFNESDMGLTEFAQKINYQRALQGELARTIMLLEGIENARVHLALPERALFRGNRSPLSAAVTLILRPGHSITASRINGIQRLVAGSVPELDVAAVAILDESGRLVSANTPVDRNHPASGEVEAVGQYYRSRISSAISAMAPDLNYRVNVVVRQRAEISLAEGVTAADHVSTLDNRPDPMRNDAGITPVGEQNRRAYAIHVDVQTVNAISSALRDQLSATIIAAADLDQQSGDRLVFGVGFTGDVATPLSSAPVATSHRREMAPASGPWTDRWWYIALVATALAGAGLGWWLTRRYPQQDGRDRTVESFADKLKARLDLMEEGV